MVEPTPLRSSDNARASAEPPAAAKPAAKVMAFPGKPIRLNAEEREFLPAALEVIETPLSPTLRLTAATLCVIIVGAVSWASLSHIDMVAVAEGKVVPLGQVKVVQPLETAMIRTIHVDEGDHVKAGQLLVDLDPTEARADLDSLRSVRAQAALDAEVARVLLSRNPEEEFRPPADADPVLVAQSRDQAHREIEKHLATMAAYQADIAQKSAALEANDAQIERARLTIPLLQEKNDVAKGLFEKGYGPRPPVLESEQQLVEKRAELRSAQVNVDQIQAEIRALKARLAESAAGYLADATDRRTKALTKVAQLDQDLTKARQKESYRRLAAPVDGSVQGLKIHTPGAVVTTADTLMTIVPDGTGIEVDCLIQNKDIGFVSEGQDAEVKLEAFPFTRFGLVHGRVRKLGRDAATSPNAPPGSAAALVTQGSPMSPGAPPELSYPAKVTLLQDWIAVNGRHEPIRPGMRVSAEIKTGERRVIEYLLSPVIQAVKEAGRER
ncbi:MULTISPECIES: HlyD family type I secretion periplasmic adaptor subunit [Bradyrhizobium]|jgi:hemolysin D|uniref:Membrane fusion protein (MFP) family protein n=4 Tax=Bradyrhizobium TaxID=374 RepID=A0ABS5G9C9_9BRAD|nr:MULTISPECIES: HlyD family type I secretion periplasmic adaptor subunit [Bradyrhizobium]MBR1137944.1 HlyD family type I secretion periplasmic adaptor subunit [Bradyrhizobium denitrificans]MDU0958603.1 HlyD family type I secretion periplasmic adaptor subunit [Bradyrhizobium sp.]MDU1490611.1 HlyD family type I secretion periplasmic adaptor subunit [Bradyrhizobium sp.]MDU1545659.1 HlyD family type I secretion periplasmic adaptor subunit [Bradyrhizobium sp.]MDU1694106.1 HlyD family type I secret